MSAQPIEPPEALAILDSLSNTDALGLPGHNSPTSDHRVAVAQTSLVAGGGQTPAGSTMCQPPPTATRQRRATTDAPALRVTDTLDADHRRSETQIRSVDVEGQTPAATATDVTTPMPAARSLLDPTLVVLADVLDDLERVRIANENRVRQLTRSVEDADGLERGFGLTLDHPQVAALQATVEGLAALEAGSALALKRAMRKHPLGPWVKATAGVGEKQGARLLASLGDPYWNSLHNRPRTVSELWAYAGYDPDENGVARRRARGQKANWSAAAKMRAYLVAEACMKCRSSPYRKVYDAGREKYATAVHLTPCVRCGPKNKPAEIGTPISAGHQHARALRLVAKKVLKDLWAESRRLHEENI